MSSKALLVIGAGSWGTALAIQSARLGHATRLWGIDVDQWPSKRCNERYLPGIDLPDSLSVYTDLDQAMQGVQDVLLVVPSHAFADVLHTIKPYVLDQGMRVAWGTKGFDVEGGGLLADLACQVLGDAVPLAILSGPSFAKEVAEGLPSSVTLACADQAFSKALLSNLHGTQFSMYTSDDMVGVAVGGAVKNVIAVAVGLCDGLQFGANTRCALITRGLNEMTQLGVCLGAQAQTFMGLSGMGDLVLTCTDDQSRNRRFGLALASGLDVPAAEQHIGQVVEGKKAVVAVCALAKKHGIEMPISTMVYRIVCENMSPAEGLKALLSQGPCVEFDVD